MAETRPLVSVVVPAHNAGAYIEDAILSVLSQTIQDVECVVVDDGSTDDTGDRITSFGDKVRYVRQVRSGVSAARNKGIEQSRGQLVAFLDADDLWLPKKLEVQVTFFNTKPDLGLIYSGFHVVDQKLRFIGRQDPPQNEDALRNTLLLEKPSMTGLGSTGVIPRAILDDIGGFDERLSTSADCDIGCRIATLHPVYGVPRPLALYRVHPHQMHGDTGRTENDMKLIFDKMFRPGSLPIELLGQRNRALANLYVSLAGAALMAGRRNDAIRYLVRAMVRRPDRVLSAIKRLTAPGAGLSRAA